MDSYSTSKRADFFSDIHLWPPSSKLDYKGWLANFSRSEQNIALEILDFFMYFSEPLINSLFRHSIGRVGNCFKQKSENWTHESFFDNCYYSFIAGESSIPDPLDSGHIFLRKLRDELGIAPRKIYAANVLYTFLNTLDEPANVILVDDFVGSGQQCIHAWNKDNTIDKGSSLRNLVNKKGHNIVYAPLIANDFGYRKIGQQCEKLSLSSTYILGNEYNLFHAECLCWKGSIDNYQNGIDLILTKSEKIGIPTWDGGHVNDAMGYCKQGLALGFEHGIPDAVPAIFYWKENGWTPLMKRKY